MNKVLEVRITLMYYYRIEVLGIGEGDEVRLAHLSISSRKIYTMNCKRSAEND